MQNRGRWTIQYGGDRGVVCIPIQPGLEVHHVIDWGINGVEILDNRGGLCRADAYALTFGDAARFPGKNTAAVNRLGRF